MKPKKFSVLLLFCLSLLFVPAWAIENTIPMSEKDSILIPIPTLGKGGEGGFESSPSKQSSVTLEVTDNLINLKAEQASFKESLNDLEKKTGIKVKIFEGVEDKKVMLNINCMLIYDS